MCPNEMSSYAYSQFLGELLFAHSYSRVERASSYRENVFMSVSFMIDDDLIS